MQICSTIAEGVPIKFGCGISAGFPDRLKAIYYYLYLIFDLYSRKIIAWDVWLEESAENASLLVRRGMLSEQRRPSPQPLVLHSDNGSPTKELSLLETLYQLGFTPSRSRL